MTPEDPSSGLSRDPTASVEWHRPDDRFVPLRPLELVEALAADAARFSLTAAQVRDVAQALRDVILQEAGAFQCALADLYAVFNPDRDTKPLEPLPARRTREAYADLDRRLRYLLDKANFARLSAVQVDAAIRTANAYGLRIRLDPARIEDLAVWVRGRGTTRRVHRTWRHPRRGVEQATPVYRRLAIVARLKNDPHVIVKLFKDIPQTDVEALLPHAEVGMGWQDRLMVFGGGAGALGSSAGKILGVFTGVAALSQALWVVLVGAGMMTLRTALGYRRARNSRDWQRTRHLYFQNLANNASAVQMLIATVAEEELKEALLAFVFCCGAADVADCEGDLDQYVEAYLAERFAVRVDFDSADALETLTRLDLLASRRPLRIGEVDAAVARLRAHWQAQRSRTYHEDMADRPSVAPPQAITPPPQAGAALADPGVATA